MSKPRFGARVDDVQREIVDALEGASAKVLVLDVGEEGAPDLLVGWLGGLTLLELKSKGGRLSPAQCAAHEEWARVGVRVVTCRTQREALAAIGLAPEAIARRLQAMRALIPREKQAARRLQPSVRRPT